MYSLAYEDDHTVQEDHRFTQYIKAHLSTHLQITLLKHIRLLTRSHKEPHSLHMTMIACMHILIEALMVTHRYSL